jgi:hypothetical protein
VLYFSSTLTGAGDLYYSRWIDGSFQGRVQVPGVNTAAWTEGQPNVRRDGLEIFYFSNRPSGIAGTGGNDIYAATRATTADDWENAHGLGVEVNSPAAETRPSLSGMERRCTVETGPPGAASIGSLRDEARPRTVARRERSKECPEGDRRRALHRSQSRITDGIGARRREYRNRRTRTTTVTRPRTRPR